MSDKLTLYVPLDSVAVSLGADALVAELRKTAQANKIELDIVRTGSRGMHWLEPLIEIETQNVRHGFGPIDLNDIPTLFSALNVGNLEHPKSVGPVEEIPFFAEQDRLIFKNCGAHDPLDFSSFASSGGLAGVEAALALPQTKACETVLASGLRGRGGAAFPAGIKWNTVEQAVSDQKYVVCNADEGDSGTFADRMIMEGDPFLLIAGMVIAGLSVGASEGYIYLRSEYPAAEGILRRAIEVARKNRLLGPDVLGSGRAFELHLFMGAGAYICGEETSLLNSLEGKRGEVRAKPPLPALQGLFDKPTLVHNVITLCSVPFIFSNGANAYKNYGSGKSLGTMPFQLAGNIKQGGLFEAPFGINLKDLIQRHGGGTATGRSLKAIQIGGPLGAYLPEEMLDISLDYETLVQSGAGIGHGGIVVFDESVNLLDQARYAFEFCAEESCGKCTPCRVGAVRGVEIINRIRDGIDLDIQRETLDDLCELMIDGSLCAMGGMTPIPVQSALKHFPEDFITPVNGKERT